MKGRGILKIPVIPSVLSSTPSGTEKENFCSKPTKNRNSSILARLSPKHMRFPKESTNTHAKVRISRKTYILVQFMLKIKVNVAYLWRKAEKLLSLRTFPEYLESVLA